MEPPTGASSEPYDYDLLVIGGGSGGLAAAKEAAGFRKKVLILDLTASSPRGGERVLGGSRLNLDTYRKYFHQASLLGRAVADSQKYGWRMSDSASHGWSELVAAVRERLKTRSLELRRELKRCGVFYLNARGEIVAPHTVEATDMDGVKRRFTAETLVVATGSTPEYPGIPGDKEHCLTSEDLLSLPHPPGPTLVAGRSAEGFECAGFLCCLGVPVTVLHHPDMLQGPDEKMFQKVESHLLVSGVKFFYNYALNKVEEAEGSGVDHLPGDSATEPQQGRLRATMISKEGGTMQHHCDTVLLTGKSKANISGIGLECVEVKCNRDTNRIIVDEKDQTSVDYIYAVGSVQDGRPSTTGLSVHAGTLLARRLYGEDNTLCDYTYVPHVWLFPVEYAACGLSEEDANQTLGEDNVEVYYSYYWPMEWEIPRRNRNSCFVKVICHIPKEDRVVGVHVMGPNAGDIVQGFVAAIKCGLTKKQLDATVCLPHGTAQALTSLTQTQRMTDAERAAGC